VFKVGDSADKSAQPDKFTELWLQFPVVWSMWWCFVQYPCFIHALSMLYPCFIHALSMLYPCFIRALSMPYPCFIHALSMLYPRLVVGVRVRSWDLGLGT
jgi:hypothetical protein